MDAKALEARRAYKRRWAKKNPDKVKAEQERYWMKKAQAEETEEKITASPESPNN